MFAIFKHAKSYKSCFSKEKIPFLNIFRYCFSLPNWMRLFNLSICWCLEYLFVMIHTRSYPPPFFWRSEVFLLFSNIPRPMSETSECQKHTQKTIPSTFLYFTRQKYSPPTLKPHTVRSSKALPIPRSDFHTVWRTRPIRFWNLIV